MATLQRAEIWTDYQCNSGTRQAILPLDHISTLRTVERTTRDDEGTLVISKEAAAYTYLTVGAVLRLLFTDGTFSEWRVRSLQDESRQSRVATASLATPLLELATSAAILSSTTSLVTTVDFEYKAFAPSEVVTAILAFCPSYWSSGTITPTIPVNLSPAGWMPLQALRELVSAIRAQGVDAELDFRPNGTSGYYIDIVSAIGSSATALDVRTAKNLLGASRIRDRDRYATEVVPLGSGDATMATAYLEVTTKAGTTLTVAQPVVGGSMIAFDGQLDGLYLFDDAGAKQLISSSLAAGTFVVASATNVTTGRWYRIVGDSSGTDLIRMRKAPATTGPIQPIRAAALDGTTNIMTNPAMRVWTGASTDPPDGWVKLSTPTLTRTTTAGLWVYGGRSCRVQINANTQGLETAAVSFYVPAYATSVTYSAWVRLVTIGGSLELRFNRNGTVQHTVALDTGYATGVWHRIDWTESLSGLTGAVRPFKISVISTTGGTTELYFDSAQISFTAAAMSFVEGSNPSRLWTFANRYLTKYSTVPAIYRLTFADLGQWDATSFPYDLVSLGQTANVRDTDLSFTVSARVLELARDWKNPLASEITVASRPDDLVTILTGLAA